MKRMPKISEAEWRVCQVLWQASPRTSSEVGTELQSATGWSLNTVKTLLTRLVKKGVLGYENHGREYRYFPKISETECVRTETSSFVQRVFGGTAAAMVAAFISDQRLTPAEIAELKALLEQKDKENQDGRA